MDARRRKQIIDLALPIIGGMASQNVLNLVDTAMVGRLSRDALAAVGIASITSFLLSAFLMGLSSAVQATTSRRLGESRFELAAIPLNGALLLVVVVGLPWSMTLFGASASILPVLVDDPNVLALGVPYLQARVLGFVAVGANYSFRGYFNGVKRSGLYLRALVTMHATNVVLSYVLIFGKLGFPELGVLGAGIGTTVSLYVGAATYFVLALRHGRAHGFLKGLPDRSARQRLFALTFPSSIQQSLFAAGYAVLFVVIGMVGTVELAAANVLTNLMLLTMLPGMACGMASASFVGQALGRDDPSDAAAWAWDVVRVALVIMVPLGLPLIAVPDHVLSVFTADPATIATARWPLRLIGGAVTLDAVSLVLMHSLLGAGAARVVMLVSVGLQWGMTLPLAYLLGPVAGFGLTGVWCVLVLERVSSTLLYTGLWRGRGWADAHV